jgi:hypothetical protein
MEEYMRMLIPRLWASRDALAGAGSLWVHLDWHAAHYVKVVMDAIFGAENFINEVIWNYKSGGVSSRRFARKHDTLLFYAKTKNYYFAPQREKSYNRGFKPYRFKGVKEYRDEAGWYTMVNMKDVWQMDMVGRTSAERTGYATQKPEALLARILESCTREGDLCADFFCGSGTLAAAAEGMGRRWLLCDIGRIAVINSQKRMLASGAGFSVLADASAAGGGAARAGAGAFDADVSCEGTVDPGKKLVTVRLREYRLTDLAQALPVDERYFGAVENAMKSDSLRVVDYWSVDFHYDGKTFRPQAAMARDGGGVAASASRLLGAHGPVAVRVVDIFGNDSFRVL